MVGFMVALVRIVHATPLPVQLGEHPSVTIQVVGHSRFRARLVIGVPVNFDHQMMVAA
jgi:hypothetical protein